jgi:hypothetical protein
MPADAVVAPNCPDVTPKSVKFIAIPSGPHVCADCVAMGSKWVHLRLCLTCGQTHCCDSSPNKHARKHFTVTGHPLIRSIEPHDDRIPLEEQQGIADETFVACFIHTNTPMDVSEMPAPALPKHRKVGSAHAH